MNPLRAFIPSIDTSLLSKAQVFKYRLTFPSEARVSLVRSLSAMMTSLKLKLIFGKLLRKVKSIGPPTLISVFNCLLRAFIL